MEPTIFVVFLLSATWWARATLVQLQRVLRRPAPRPITVHFGEWHTVKSPEIHPQLDTSSGNRPRDSCRRGVVGPAWEKGGKWRFGSFPSHLASTAPKKESFGRLLSTNRGAPRVDAIQKRLGECRARNYSLDHASSLIFFFFFFLGVCLCA